MSRAYDRFMAGSDRSFAVDEGSAFGARVAAHLREDVVVWLTTVGAASGAPQPSPVWFWWDGAGTVTVQSLPDTSRGRNLRANPRLSLNFAGDGRGGDVVVLTGSAELLPPPAGAGDVPAGYLEKYRSGFERLNLSADDFVRRYSLPLRITLTGLRGH